MDKKKIVMEMYDSLVEREWERLSRHPFEREITLRFMDKYIKPGDSILDVSGGPGRYTVHYAKKGCDVTLVDLSEKNVEFAEQIATKERVKIKALQGDACFVDKIVTGQYEHVFLMGALYHLQNEKERIQAVKACLKLLKPGDYFYVSFITNVAGVLYALDSDPAYIMREDSDFKQYIECFLNDEDFTGLGFTYAHFTAPKNVLPFFKKFNLEKLHLFGQESVVTQAERRWRDQPEEVINKWIDFCVKIAEREDLLSHSNHLMYIGRKL